MRFQIRKIVLWPRKKGVSPSPRVIKFDAGKVNVISGASKTGKSAIIPIIDYCLCGREYKVPVDIIRDACAWFGVVVETEKGQKLFCRREPGQQKSTDHMYFAESPGEVDIPDEIVEKNNSASDLRRTLDEFAGLTNLDFDFQETGSGYRGRPSFGDMKAFCFQPQNIIANPDVLFFKADTTEHREKLRTIFPYVLNAMTARVLAAKHEHEAVRKLHARKRRDLELLRSASQHWVAELRSWISEALDLGLLEHAVPTDAMPEQMISTLRDVIERTEPSTPTSEGITEVVHEIGELREEESQAALELAGLRRRFAEMSRLKESAEAFAGAMEIQRDRLAISSWLRTLKSDDADCPLCSSRLNADNAELDRLCRTLDELEREASVSRSIPASFDRELSRVQDEMQVVTERLSGVRMRLQSAEMRSEQARRERYQAGRVDQLVGGVRQALRTHDAATADGSLATEVEELQRRLQALASEFSESQIKRRTDNALSRFTTLAARITPDLDAEHNTDPIALQVEDLTLKTIRLEREYFLWEIGSGANWLSYHIAVAVALQELFLGFEHTPVPGFVVFDQPSQVYFPRKLARTDQEDEDPELDDEDVAAVRKAFSALAKAVKRAESKLQFIVLDHASDNVWGDVEGVHRVEEWRDGTKLVPLEWLQ